VVTVCLRTRGTSGPITAVGSAAATCASVRRCQAVEQASPPCNGGVCRSSL